MNAESIYSEWTTYIDRDAGGEADQALLVREASASGALCRELVDDSAIDSMIELLAVGGDDAAFVLGCISRFHQLEPAAVRSSASQSIAIDSRRKPNVRLPMKRMQKRRARAKWALAAMSIAALALVACFVVVVHRQNQRSLAGTIHPAQADTIPVADGNVEPNERDVDSNDSLPPLNSSNEPKEQRGHDDNDAFDVVVDEAVRPGENPDLLSQFPLPQNPSAEHVVPDAGNDSSPGSEFATLERESNAAWVAGNPTGRLGAGTLKLLLGSAEILLDNGVTIALIGPAELGLQSARRMEVVSGKVRIGTRTSESDFEFSSPDTVFGNSRQATVFLVVNEHGTEVVLSDGSVELLHRATHEPNNPPTSIVLDTRGLNHAFVTSAARRKSAQTPADVVVAHGTDRYLGQISFGNAVYIASAPLEMEQHLDTLQHLGKNRDEGANRLDDPLLRQQVQQFNAMFLQMRQNGIAPTQQGVFEDRVRRYSFQGEISIDGDKIEFTNPDDYRDFLDRLNQPGGTGIVK